MANDLTIGWAELASWRAHARLSARTLGLLGVVAVAAVLNLIALRQNGYANIFYSAGVRSMLHSWHNLLFVSFDQGGLVSIDKPPLGLWLQALSAWIFGFRPLSLLAPEALAGIAAVAAMYLIVARRFGLLAGLAAGLTLAVFPSFVAVSRDNNVDAPLILLIVLACGATLRATERGSLRALLGAPCCWGWPSTRRGWPPTWRCRAWASATWCARPARWPAA